MCDLMLLELSPDAVDVVAAGLDWIYDTEQPDDAILQHHGYSHRAGDVVYRFCGRGRDGRPVVVLNRAEPTYSGDGVLTNPLTTDELVVVPLLLDRLGHPASTFWNSADPAEPPSSTGSFGLAQPAHPSLLAALDRYRAGCPDHNTVFCDQQRGEARAACMWFRDGNAKAVAPTWPDLAAA